MFLATMIVVVRHSINIHVYFPDIYSTGFRDVNSFVQIYINRFTDIAVPFFFIISGYLFFYDFKIEDIFKKWKKRFFSLFIPYILWNILLIAFFLIIQNWEWVAQFSNYDRISLKLVKLVPLITTNPIVGQFWYIRDLMIFILLSPLLYLLFRNKYIALFLIAVLLYLWKPVDTSLFSSEGVLFFTIGGFLGYQKIDLQINISKSAILLTFLLWVCLKTVLILPLEKGVLLMQLIPKISILIGIFFIWTSADLLIKKFSQSRILLLSSFSFFIYAFHTPLIKIFYKIMLSIFPESQLTGLLVFFISPIIIVLISLMAAKGLKSIFPWFYNLLTGNRSIQHYALKST